MPINPKLKEQLTRQVADEAYRTRLIATLEDAPPDVQNLWMSSEEYNRQTNAYKGEMKTFYDKSNAAIDGWKAEKTKAEEARDQALARVAELEASGGPGAGGIPNVPGAGAEVTRELAGLKSLIAEIEKKLPTEVVTKKDLEGAYQSAVGFIGEQVFTMGELSAKHQISFGERFDKAKQEELIAYANEVSGKRGARISLEEAYSLKYGEQMIEKRIKEASDAAVEKDRTAREVPGGGPAGIGASAPEQGPLQIRLKQLHDSAAGKKDGVYGDWREAAAAAGDELVKEGKY